MALDVSLQAQYKDNLLLIAFLDDFTVGASSGQSMRLTLGCTQLFLDQRQVELNKKKCAILSNALAHDHADTSSVLGTLQDQHSQVLLGCDTGVVPEPERQRERVAKAQALAERMELLRLPQRDNAEMVRVFLLPLLFGIHFCPLQDVHFRLERVLRRLCFGTARASANWQAAQALSIRTSTVTPAGYQFSLAFAALQIAAGQEDLRGVLLQRWQTGVLSRPYGPWAVALDWLAKTGGRALSPGTFEWEQAGIHLDIHEPKRVYKHKVRMVWRCYLLSQAGKARHGFFSFSPRFVDWCCTRGKKGKEAWSDAMRTAQCYGINTAGRSLRHFQHRAAAQCEHACPEEDHMAHRLLHCQGTQSLRRQMFTDEQMEWLHAAPVATQMCAIFFHEEDELDYLGQVQCPHGFWATKEVVSRARQAWSELDVVQRNSGPLQCCFHYMQMGTGVHFMQKLHGAVLKIPLLGLELVAHASTEDYQRVEWEWDCILLVATLIGVLGCRARLQGLTLGPVQVGSFKHAKNAANRYLWPLLLEVKDKMEYADLEKGQNKPNIDELQNVLPPQWFMHRLSFRWQIARRMSRFIALAMDAFPVAQALSARGRSSGRWTGPGWGGLNPNSAAFGSAVIG